MFRAFIAFLTLTAFFLPNTEADASRYGKSRSSADGIGKTYMGREIAGVMGWQGAAWLERPERVSEERPDLLLAELNLKPGMIVADIGAGTGYHSRRMSSVVGTTGRVYAVDVQPQMIQMLSQLSREPQYANIKPILSTVYDVKLPQGAVDLAIMVDVYHELEFPYEVMTSILKSLKPGGRVVFVEYRANQTIAQDERSANQKRSRGTCAGVGAHGHGAALAACCCFQEKIMKVISSANSYVIKCAMPIAPDIDREAAYPRKRQP
jgi:ubiquinone/menaquinone biosynthesis C-methylase UbiE